MSMTAREIMTPDPVCVRSSDSVLEAAMRMVELNIGSLPIYGEDNTVRGVITDRDIVVKVIAAAHDPRAVHVGELAQGQVVTIAADDSAEEIMATMRQHQAWRLPVTDGDDLVGVVALADVTRSLSDPPVGTLVEELSTDR
ncbi:MAG: CBS domain-containing protein [Pseudonocardiaceae bacterium]